MWSHYAFGWFFLLIFLHRSGCFCFRLLFYLFRWIISFRSTLFCLSLFPFFFIFFFFLIIFLFSFQFFRFIGFTVTVCSTFICFLFSYAWTWPVCIMYQSIDVHQNPRNYSFLAQWIRLLATITVITGDLYHFIHIVFFMFHCHNLPAIVCLAWRTNSLTDFSFFNFFHLLVSPFITI